MPKRLSLSPTRFASDAAELDLTAVTYTGPDGSVERAQATCKVDWSLQKPYLQLKIGDEKLKYYLADLTEMEFTVTPPSSLRFKLTNAIARKNSSDFWEAQGATTPGWKTIALQGEEVKRCRAAFLEPENRASSPALGLRTEPRTGTNERSPLSDDVIESMGELTLGERLTADAACLSVVSIGVLAPGPGLASTPPTRRLSADGVERHIQVAGSGFCVGPDGLVLTDEHVRLGAECLISRAGGRLVACPCSGLTVAPRWAEDALTVEVLAHTGAPKYPGDPVCPFPSANAVTLPSRADLAVLRVTGRLSVPEGGSPYSPPPNLPLPEGAPRLEPIEELLVLGYPKSGGESLTFTSGRYSGMDTNDDGSWLKLQGLIMKGHSGGPVVSLRLGVVVGVNTSTLVDPRAGAAAGLNHCRPIEDASEVLAEARAEARRRDAERAEA